jgi:hypothetical protein
MKDEILELITELSEFEGKMSEEDLYDFQMLQKRANDGEEFDRLSRRRVEELHKKYIVKKIVKDIDSLLKKYTKQVKDIDPGKAS